MSELLVMNSFRDKSFQDMHVSFNIFVSLITKNKTSKAYSDSVFYSVCLKLREQFKKIMQTFSIDNFILLKAKAISDFPVSSTNNNLN